MLFRQEVNTMRHLANAQCWDRPAGGNTGRLFLAFGGPVCADRFSNCPLDRVLTYKNLIYLLNLQIFLLLPHIFFIIGFTALQVLRGSGKPYMESLKSWSQWGHRMQFLL